MEYTVVLYTSWWNLQVLGGLTGQILHIYSVQLKHRWERIYATIRQYIECTLLQDRFWSLTMRSQPPKKWSQVQKAPQMSEAPSYGVQGSGRVEGPTPLRIQRNNQYPLLWTTGNDGA